MLTCIEVDRRRRYQNAQLTSAIQQLTEERRHDQTTAGNATTALNPASLGMAYLVPVPITATDGSASNFAPHLPIIRHNGIEYYAVFPDSGKAAVTEEDTAPNNGNGV